MELAQELPPPSAAGRDEWLRVGGVTLLARDLRRLEAFYRDVIGLEVIASGAGVVRLGVAGRYFLDLLHRPDALPDDPAAAGLFHTAFLLPSRADLGRWLRHAAAEGQPLDGAADHLVSEAVYLHDPEGNGIEIYADRPQSRWSWRDGPDGRRRLQMANDRLDKAGLMEAAGAWTGAPASTRIGHLHLRVGDAREAAGFYGGVLGMDLTAASPNAVFLSTGGYHHHLAANAWHSAGAGARDEKRAGLACVTFEVADGPALVDLARRAEAPDLAQDGLRDPWGTLLRFRFAEPPGELPEPPASLGSR